jgi:virulence-associated protein VagC
MEEQSYARSQADGLDNIAPSPKQAAAASQYAVTDGFISSEEQSAVLRQEIEADRPLLQNKLNEIGITKAYLKANPAVEKALFSGQPTSVVTVQLPNDLLLNGRLRIAVTDQGTQLKITPVMPGLTIPDKVGDLQLTQQEREDLLQSGYVERPIQMPENGQYVSAFLRVDKETNTVDAWKVKPEMLPTKLLGIDLTRDQQLQLVCGYPVQLSGLKDQQGESFDATVKVSVSKQGLEFSNLSRQDVVFKPVEKHQHQVAQNNEGAKTDLIRSREEKTGINTTANAQNETLKRLLMDDQTPNQHRKNLRPKP